VKRAGFHGSFWPTPTQEELLRVGLGPIDQAEARWQALQRLDIERLDVGSFGLLPVLYERLTEAAPDEPRLPRLLGTYRATWYRNQLLLDRLMELLSAFRARELDALLVGGASVGSRWYRRLGSRPVPQLELVVAPDAGTAAREAARETGWRPAGRSPFLGRFVDGDGRVLVVWEGIPPLLAGPIPRAEAYAEIHGSALDHDLGVRVRVLQPVDELLHICAFGARTAVPPSIQWLLDTAMLLAAPVRPSTDEVVERARRFGLIDQVRDTVAYLVQMCDVTGLDRDLAALRAERVPRRNRTAYRLGGSGVDRLGGLPLTLASHVRATSSEPVWRAVARLPRHLQEAWELERVRRVPSVAFKKAARRARRRSAERQRKTSTSS
jgi:putative nucleotidyltransferase-like protein